MIVFDFDGTVANHQAELSRQDLASLVSLAGKKTRVVASGRSPYSFRCAVGKDFPIDYAILSSGACIIDWPRQKILWKNELSGTDVQAAAQSFNELNISYTVNMPSPDNHIFYYQENTPHPDFSWRLNRYQAFASTWKNQATPAASLLGISDYHPDYFEIMKAKLPLLKIIRSTSPFDNESLGLEIFPRNVSKGHGAEWLRAYLDIDMSDTIALGNDYNDIEMLDWATKPFVVDNAPIALKNIYPSLAVTHLQDSFTGLLKRLAHE